MKNCLNEKRINFIYSLVLLTLSAVIYYPCFSIPPRSDYWHMFYFFHHLDQFPGSVKWLHVLNYDLFEQMRYQPIPPFLYYVYHRVFGSNFILFVNIINFAFYLLSILVIYKFILIFCKNSTLAFIFIALFVSLFSHSDILLWSYHSYLFLSFSLFMLGFIKYIDFLRTGKIRLLGFVIAFMLLGMVCYEPFFFWPFAIIILSSLNLFKREEHGLKTNTARLNTLILAIIYTAYFLFYLFTRSLKTYQYQSHEIYEFLTIANIIKGFFATLFSITYNNIVVNIFPFISFPLRVRENVDLGGGLINLIETFPKIVFIGGALLFILAVLLLVHLIKNKYFEELKIIILLTFLPFSFVFIVFLGRLVTNDISYGLTQFRYQYIPNVFIVLLTIFTIDRIWKGWRGKKIIYFFLFAIFISNIFCIYKLESLYNYQFSGLKRILTGIKTAIRKGNININNKLYIDPDLQDYLPVLCWNIEIGERFIPEGNYQWIFSPKEVNYFSSNLKDATWIIDKQDFNIVLNSPENISKKVLKINSSMSEKDKTYICVDKDKIYMEVAFFYKSKRQYSKAEEMFNKAIKFNPRNYDAHIELAYIYKTEQRCSEEEEVLRKASELDSQNN